MLFQVSGVIDGQTESTETEGSSTLPDRRWGHEIHAYPYRGLLNNREYSASISYRMSGGHGERSRLQFLLKLVQVAIRAPPDCTILGCANFGCANVFTEACFRSFCSAFEVVLVRSPHEPLPLQVLPDAHRRDDMIALRLQPQDELEVTESARACRC